MKEFGILIFTFAVVPLLIALWNRRKMKKILAAPFVKTAIAASNPAVADAKGTVSVEGAIVPTQPFMAPCSGSPVARAAATCWSGRSVGFASTAATATCGRRPRMASR